MAALLTAGLAASLAGWLLFYLYRKIVGGRMNQAFREDGPAHHLKKGRVPTGAGIVFVLACAGIAIWTWFGNSDVTTTAVFSAAALMGLLGFIDDRSKVTGGSAGLKARFKFPAMILCGALLLYKCYESLHDLSLAGHVHHGWLAGLTIPVFFLLGLFIWLGAINGSNFTDGLDGLLGSTSLVVLLSVLMFAGNPEFDLPVVLFTGIVLAYMLFNWKPASIYMGDSGSLCIGALIAGLFLSSGNWLYLGLAAFIWVVEVLSVMIQVIYFRRTGGKRLFLMTPIHHHFELAGWNETTIVYVFALLQAWGCMSAWLWLKQGLLAGLVSSFLLTATFVALVLRYRKRVA